MNFSSLQSSVQKFGMNQALKYLEKDPETNIPKLMNLVDKVMPEGCITSHVDHNNKYGNNYQKRNNRK